MHKNIFWQAFLIFIFGVTLWYTVSAVYHYYIYSHLTAQSALSSLRWEIEERNEDKYLLVSHYSFKVKDQIFTGTTIWSQEPYLNSWAAEKAAEKLSKQYWKVWYDPAKPDRSTLDKKFPYKDLISAAFLWGLFLYFLWLGYYVTRFKT